MEICASSPLPILSQQTYQITILWTLAFQHPLVRTSWGIIWTTPMLWCQEKQTNGVVISTNGKTHSQWWSMGKSSCNFVKIPNVPLHMKLLLPFTKNQDILKKSKRKKKTKRKGKRHHPLHRLFQQKTPQTHPNPSNPSNPKFHFHLNSPSLKTNSSPLIMIISKFGIISFFQRGPAHFEVLFGTVSFRGDAMVTHPLPWSSKVAPHPPPGPPWRHLCLLSCTQRLLRFRGFQGTEL